VIPGPCYLYFLIFDITGSDIKPGSVAVANKQKCLSV